MKKNIFTLIVLISSFSIYAQEVSPFLNIKRNSTSSISAHLGYTDSNWTGAMFWNKIGDVRLRAQNSEFHFGSNGNLGIGTANPREKLNVYQGNILITSGLNTNNSSHNGIQFTTDNQPYYSAINAYRGSHSKSIGLQFTTMNGNTNSIEAMSIDPFGNVGIGTTNPQAKLEVSSANSGDAILRIEADEDNNNESDNPMIQFRQDGGQLGVNLGFSEDNFGSNIFGIGTRYTNQQSWNTFVINTQNGNLGMGTKLPKSRLEITSNPGQTEELLRFNVSDAPKDYLRVNNATGVANRFIPSIKGNVESSNVGSLFLVASTNAANDNNGSSGLMRFDTRRSSNDQGITNRPLFEWTNFDKKLMTIKANGNLGIGTTNPGAKLHVSEGTQLRKTTIGLTTASAENSFIRDEWLTGAYGPAKWDQTKQKWVRPGGTYNDMGGIVYQDEGTYFLRENRGTKLEYTNSEFLNTAFMFAHISTGNVGIGTTTPDAKLTVNGNIHAKEVKIDLNVPAPDYVFKSDYDLLSIEEVQQHIKDNGHLPNIPSAKDMETNGVELGLMNMKLLEKIEELTLYTIAQEKEIKELKKLRSSDSELQTLKTKNQELESRLEKLEQLLIKK